MFNAKVFRVFIASPIDAAELRQIAKDVIEEWNHVHAEAFGTMLLPTLWEHDASPGSGRAQTSINEELLDNSDIVVAIWRHIWGSGTQEEIDRSIRSSSREVMQYFSLEPVPNLYEGTERRSLLRRYQDAMTRAGEPFYWTYNDPSHFKTEFSRHLGIKVQRITSDYISRHPAFPQISEDSKHLITSMVNAQSKTVLFSKSRSGVTFLLDSGENISFDVFTGDLVLGECVDNELISRVPETKSKYYITPAGRNFIGRN